MITARSPLRISLGGGGTDLASYYRDHEGYLLSAAIDKYIYVSVMRPFKEGIYLKYSELENVKDIASVNHPIIREALSLLEFKTPQIEITTLADIPAGTGLGSSGSFTTALLKALFTHRKKHIHQEELAKLACYIEIKKLKEPIGKQDQYIAAFGGISTFQFNKDESVITKPLDISMDTLLDLEENLLLFFTGFSRSASKILLDQKEKSNKDDKDMLDNLHYVKDLGYRSKNALESGKLNAYGEIMHEHWENKKRRSKGMSNPEIDTWYQAALNNGAIGGKVVGAGGGGFLMFMANDRDKLRNEMKLQGLEEVRFKFDFEGTKIISSS
jgi:D-glycero-alpha-D-manno-heptose-7-phosphate kinase